MNIIIINVDALRPDHLGVNGYHRNTSPNMDKFARDSINFSNAYTTLPNTYPSITSMLTGTYPHFNGVRMLFNNKLKDSVPTLQGILEAHGYTTAFMKCGNMHEFGLERGFQEFDPLKWKIEDKIKRVLYKVLHPKKSVGVTQQYTDRAIKWVRKNSGKKFFLYMHYLSLHWPYEPPPPFDSIFDSDYRGNHSFNNPGKENNFTREEVIFGHKNLPKMEIEHAIAHYDGAIRYIDSNIGRLLDFMSKEGIDKGTIIILTSDHGENFGEHNFYFQHGEHIYEEAIRITLLMKAPGIDCRNKKIRAIVQNMDVMPTVLDLLKIQVIDRIDGVSLLPLIKGEKEEAREFVFAESIENYWTGNTRKFFEGVRGKWRTMISGNWKIIYIPHPQEGIFELYNLKDDPKEENNLMDKEKEAASAMKKKILDFLKNQSNEGKEELSDLTEKSKKLLKSLGYIN